MEYIKGPDFPTGATILGKSGIRAMPTEQDEASLLSVQLYGN